MLHILNDSINSQTNMFIFKTNILISILNKISYVILILIQYILISYTYKQYNIQPYNILLYIA